MRSRSRCRTRTIAASSPSTASTIGCSRGCRPPSRASAARHVHFAFAPDNCPRWTRIVERLRARGDDDVVGLRMESLAAAVSAAFAGLVGSLDFVFVNEVEVGHVRAHAPERVGDRVLAPRRAQYDRQAGPARKPVDRGDTGPHGCRRRECGPWTRPAPATRSTAASSSPCSADARRASACESATSSARGRRSPPAGSSACRGAASSHERRSAVKIAVIGGAGVRTPLLVSGLTDSDLPIEEIALYDADRAAPGDHRRRGGADVRRRAHHTLPIGRPMRDRRRLRLHEHPRRRHRAARARRGDGAAPRHRRAGDDRAGGLRDGGAHHPAHGRLRARDRRRARRRPGSSTSPTRSAW